MSLEDTLKTALNPLAPSFPKIPRRTLLPAPPAAKTPEDLAPNVTANIEADLKRKKAAEAGLSDFTVPLLKAPAAA